MQGPSAALMRRPARRARAIAATVASITPSSAPFQPACAAPITRASASANRIMPQSAPVTPSAEARRRGDQRVATRPRLAREWRRNRQRVGRMDLIGDRPGASGATERRRHARAVGDDGVLFVARADAAVERSIDAVGDAAAAGEERVARRRAASSVAALRDSAAVTPASPERAGSRAAPARRGWRPPSP